MLLVLLVGTARAQINSIGIENQQPGSAAWDIPSERIGTDAVGQIKGYASAASVNKGESLIFYVSANPAQTYTIDVYRVGWYQGLGGRFMQHIGPLSGVTQPVCPMNATTGMIECDWTPAYTLATQTTWTSGVYLAVLTNAQGFQNYMIFVVRDDTRAAALLYQQPVTTYQAYNNYPNDGATGKSLYDFNSFGPTLASTGYKQAAKVSFDRPYSDVGIDNGFRSDYGEVNFIRWMERSGYDVTYSTDVDTHRDGSRLVNYRGFLSVGHDEYWSKPMYDAVVAARDAGVNLGFFGANAVYWQIRFESSSRGVPYRVQVCYKDVDRDPIANSALKTVNWRDLNRPEQSLIGVQYFSSNQTEAQGGLVISNSTNWVYAGTGLKDGDTLPHLVGYEADKRDSGYAGPTAVSGTYTLLSRSPWGTGPTDFSNASVYQALSGAWVFATGSMDWNWGLDDYQHGLGVVDARIQKATSNVIDRFVGASLAVTLSAATAGLGAVVTATVTKGPGTTGDWVGLFPVGAPNSSYVAWSYLNGLHTKPATGLTGAVVPFTLPLTPGTYEVRLFWSDSLTLLVTSRSSVTMLAPTIKLSASSVGPGAAVTATIANGPGTSGDWVGVFPVGAPNTGYVAWEYLNGQHTKPVTALTTATLPFTMPATLGPYEVRLFQNDSPTRVATSSKVTVVASTVTLNASSVGPGAVVTATIANGPGAAGDWVGLFSVGAANTAYVAWSYLNGQHTKPGTGLTGAAVSLTTPLTPGPYEVRLFRNDSLTRLVTSSSVTVTTPTVTLGVAIAAPGVVVAATIAKGPGTTGDWVGLFPVGAANTAYIAWWYLNGQHTKPATGLTDTAVPLTMSLQPGSYEVRLFRNDSLTRMATSGSVTVTAPTVTMSATSAAPGAIVTATIAKGPGMKSDWVGLFPVGAANTAFVTWRYLSGTQTRPASGLIGAAVPFTVPMTPGLYEVRLFWNDSWTALATGASVTVP